MITPKNQIILTLFLLISHISLTKASEGDTIWVKSHDKVDMTYYGNYDSWGVFPDTSKSFHKILLHYTMGCASTGCSDWDYTTRIELLKNTGELDSTIASIDTISTNPLQIDTTYTVFQVKESFELARVITPYGSYMKSNSNGFNKNWIHTHTFDVTDYSHLLRDSVLLRAFYGGWSSGFSVTLDFEFIEGIPPRNAFHCENLYRSGGNGWDYTNSATVEANYLPAKSVSLPANAKNSMIRIIPSGHGFDNNLNCGEFCVKKYYLKVDNSLIASQYMWRDDCGSNPIFPQGGTWLYNRANWCPGGRANAYDHEMSNLLNPNQNYSIDLNLDNYTWSGNQTPYYILDAQLFYFDDPNFTLDASIEDIISPSKKDDYKRFNPVCDNATVIIKNTGKTTLSSLTIKYRLSGGNWETFNWTGSLNFLESEKVNLPFTNLAYANFTSAINSFEVEIEAPNGSTDEYSLNNYKASTFNPVPTVASKVEFSFKTNNAANETTWKLLDHNENILYSSAPSLTALTIYRDTFDLTGGCYKLIIEDSDEDGLSWWANNDGAGYARLKIPGGATFKTFPVDFGTKIEYEFIVDGFVSINQSEMNDNKINIYPNPAKDILNIDFDMASPENLSFEILNMTGEIIYRSESQIISTKNFQLNISEYNQGIYFLRTQTKSSLIINKIIIQ